MCGITGWVSYNSDISQRRDVINKMTETMACRGPDAAGVWIDRSVGLGHRRLAVIDLPGGAQPMTLQQSEATVALVYSGEVYNFLELRDELIKRGHYFRTNSDTEVVLNGYSEWGVHVVDRLNGMFAFAIWDQRESRLVMARDRLGIKPLYYYPTVDGVVFGSEPKAIFESPYSDRVIDSIGLHQLVMAASAMNGRSIWKNCYEVEPGTVVLVDKTGIKKRRYWRLETRDHNDDFDSTIAAVRELLTDTVQRQLIADVPQCILLSGGLDSSTITALAASHLASSGRQVQTYSVDYAENVDNFSPAGIQLTRDLPYAHKVAGKVDSSHRDVVLKIDDLAHPDVLYAATKARDTPSLGQMDTSLYLLFREIRRNSTVALSGEAADEMFGGYPFFYDPSIRAAFFDPDKLADRAVSSLDWLDGELYSKLNIESFSKDLHAEWLSEVDYLEDETIDERQVRAASYLAITRGLHWLLDRKDRMSMAVGLEVRVPYCDHRLVEYLYNVPFEYKYSNGEEKFLLRRAVEDLLPNSVLRRKKSGYPTSCNPTYTDLLRHQAKEALIDSEHPVFDIISHPWLSRVVNSECQSPGAHASLQGKLSRALGILAWFDMYNPKVELS